MNSGFGLGQVIRRGKRQVMGLEIKKHTGVFDIDPVTGISEWNLVMAP